MAEQATRWNVETDTFEVLLTMADGESVMNAAETSGPRDVALAEALNYARQYEDEGPVQVYEVTRRPVGGIGSRAALPPNPEVDVLIPEQPPEPFDCALIVRCAKWCGKEKCRDHDAIAHAELVKAARLALEALNWADINLTGCFQEKNPDMPSLTIRDLCRTALAALRAALPPEGAA